MSRKLYVILALVILICVWGWPQIFDPQKRLALESKITAAQDQIHNYEFALKQYETDNGRLPTTEQGLHALVELPTRSPVPGNWNGPYLKVPVLRKDPWNRDFNYISPGRHNVTTYDLYSPGPDGIPGNRDDIGNWR